MAGVVERLWPGRGGVESAARHLVEELARRNLDVTAVCRVAADPIPAGVRVLRLRVPRSWQPLRLLAFSRAAARATRNGFDLVHSLARTRHQHVYRAGGGSHAGYMERVYTRPALRRLSPRHRAILAVEEAVFRDPRQIIQCNAPRNAAEIAIRYGVPTERLAMIYNGVDVERFQPRPREVYRDKLREELGLEGPVALFVGSGFERKGLDRAITGLADAGSRATLLVAGTGNTAVYRRLAERLGVAARVRFLGARADVEALHAAADLFVLPTRYDPFANACLEAMASGLPIATTRENGVADLIEERVNGFVLEGNFAPAFALLEEPGALAEVGVRARRTALELTWKRHADEVVQLYERIAGRGT